MSQVQKVAEQFQVKLAQIQVREYPMGTLEKPDLNNVVKNIQTLIKAFNQMNAQMARQQAQEEANSTDPAQPAQQPVQQQDNAFAEAVQALQGAGVQISS